MTQLGYWILKINLLFLSEASDIDLYAGAVSELPEGASLLGPTFKCIFVRQFRTLKFGDRHFYEWNRGSAGFTRGKCTMI